MDNITLEKITYQNYIKTIWGLSVFRKQKNFVATNKGSLAEAYVAITNGGVALPFAICKNGKPVGFLMISYGWSNDEDLKDDDPGLVKLVKESYCIWRFMIDKHYQGRGYGKKAMQLALDYIHTFPCGKAKYCWLSYEPENTIAKKLYESFGFVEQPQWFKGNEGEEMPAVLKL